MILGTAIVAVPRMRSWLDWNPEQRAEPLLSVRSSGSGHLSLLQQQRQQPMRSWLMFFSGHQVRSGFFPAVSVSLQLPRLVCPDFPATQGSSALADMLAAHPSVFIPGFEPLDVPGLTGEQKLDFLHATFSVPRSKAAFHAWRAALLQPSGNGSGAAPRVNRLAVASFDHIKVKTSAGFKMRPYVLDWGGANRSHTGATGIDRQALKSLLAKHNASVILTLRRNRLKEALSWHKARDLGIRQFNAIGRSSSSSRASGNSSTSSGGTSSAAPDSPVHINITTLQQWLAYTDAVNRALLDAAAYYGRPTLVVFYEDFLADPLREAARAASFVGVDATPLRPSACFIKAGPDSLAAAVANYAEVCVELAGGPHARFLEADACPGAARTTAGSSRGRSSGKSSSNQPTAPLAGWCAPPDKAASRWGGLSDVECMARFEQLRTGAVAALQARVAGRFSNNSGPPAGGKPPLLIFKHVHKAGGTTICRLAQLNTAAEAAPLPGRRDGWDTNCAPLQAFMAPWPLFGTAAPAGLQQHQQQHRRRLHAMAMGGAACWLGELTPAQVRVLPHSVQPLEFVASEGPLPDALPLDAQNLVWITMLRAPLDRTLSAYRWWRRMSAPESGWPQDFWAECRAYSAPANASLLEWLRAVPDNWMTRELIGRWEGGGTRLCYAMHYTATAAAASSAQPPCHPHVPRSALHSDAASGHVRPPPLTAAHLHLAKQRLHYFAAVLLLEQPNTSMALLRRLGWRRTDWAAARAGSRSDSRAEEQLSPAEVAALRSDNAWDLQLYDYAAVLHAQQVAELLPQPLL